jgi:hypothetical protein
MGPRRLFPPLSSFMFLVVFIFLHVVLLELFWWWLYSIVLVVLCIVPLSYFLYGGVLF